MLRLILARRGHLLILNSQLNEEIAAIGKIKSIEILYFSRMTVTKDFYSN